MMLRRELEKINADRKAIILITDGLDNSSATTIDDSMSFAKTRGIAIHTIGVGAANQKSLERIAKITGGDAFELASPQILEKINAAISKQKAITAAPVMHTSPSNTGTGCTK